MDLRLPGRARGGWRQFSGKASIRWPGHHWGLSSRRQLPFAGGGGVGAGHRPAREKAERLCHEAGLGLGRPPLQRRPRVDYHRKKASEAMGPIAKGGIVEKSALSRRVSFPGTIYLPPMVPKREKEEEKERIEGAVAEARRFDRSTSTVWTDGSKGPQGVGGAVTWYEEIPEEPRPGPLHFDRRGILSLGSRKERTMHAYRDRQWSFRGGRSGWRESGSIRVLETRPMMQSSQQLLTASSFYHEGERRGRILPCLQIPRWP